MYTLNSLYRRTYKSLTLSFATMFVWACSLSPERPNILWGCVNWHPYLPTYHAQTGDRYGVKLFPGEKVKVLGKADANVAEAANEDPRNVDLNYSAKPSDFIAILSSENLQVIVPATAKSNDHGQPINLLVGAVIDREGNDNRDCQQSLDNPDYQGEPIILPDS